MPVTETRQNSVSINLKVAFFCIVFCEGIFFQIVLTKICCLTDIISADRLPNLFY